MPRGKLRQVSAMLKAIHAQGSREAALDKANRVVDYLKEMRLRKVAELVEDKVAETLSYYAYPQAH
jgi:putative transposase